MLEEELQGESHVYEMKTSSMDHITLNVVMEVRPENEQKEKRDRLHNRHRAQHQSNNFSQY